MTTPDPLFPELIAELNAPSRDDLIQAVRTLGNIMMIYNPEAIVMTDDTIKYCMENGK